MTAISAAVVAADIGGPKAETWQPPPEDSSDDIEEYVDSFEEDEYESEGEGDSEDEEDSSDDDERLVPRFSPASDEL